MVPYRVIVDGYEIGKISHGRARIFEVAAGRHDILLAYAFMPRGMGNTTSQHVIVDVPPGGTVRLACKANTNVLSCLPAWLFGGKPYIDLHRIDGPVTDNAVCYEE